MGEMQDQLKRLLGGQGHLTSGAVAFPRLADVLGSELASSVDEVYRRLGGVLDAVPVNFRKWDLEFDGVALELDEYLHFNRYRAITLESPVYDRLPAFPFDLYKEYCRLHEDACLRAGGFGGKWSNSSCNAQFGMASQPKVFTGGGPSRWKQRAFYDFVKDLSPLLIDVTLVRISVWDWIEDGGKRRTVEEVLSRPFPTSGAALAALVRSRRPNPASGFSFPGYQEPCPVCEAGADKVVYMIVGDPVMDAEMVQAMEAGRVALAGCIPPIEDWRDSDESWTCGRCESEWVTRRGRATPLIYRGAGSSDRQG